MNFEEAGGLPEYHEPGAIDMNEVYYVDEEGTEVPAPDPVNNSTNAGKNSALEQGVTVPSGWKPTLKQPLPVVRCTGINRNGDRKGERCGRWSIAGATVCMVHGGRLPPVKLAAERKVEAAKLRILEDSHLAVDTLFELLAKGTADNIRLGAARDILDRANIKTGFEVEVTVNGGELPSDKIMKKLASMRKAEEEPETVEEPPLEDLGESSDKEEPEQGK